jgi:hypothetical protein
MSELGESGIVYDQEKEPRGIHVQIIDFGQRCLAMRPPLALQIAILPAAVALWLLLSGWPRLWGAIFVETVFDE